jgi:hypothetical protein
MDHRITSFPFDRYFPSEGHRVRQLLMDGVWSPSDLDHLLEGLSMISVNAWFVRDLFRRRLNTRVELPSIRQIDIRISADDMTELDTFRDGLQSFCNQANHLQRIRLLLSDTYESETQAGTLLTYFQSSHKLWTHEACTVKLIMEELYDDQKELNANAVLQTLPCQVYPPRSSWLRDTYPSRLSRYVPLERPSIETLRRQRLEDTPEEKTLTHVNLKDLKCPITHELFVHPVVATDGQTYERDAIQQYFASAYARVDRTHWKTPLTGTIVTTTEVYPNHRLKAILDTMLNEMTPSLEEDPLWSRDEFRQSKQQSRWNPNGRRTTVLSCRFVRKKKKQPRKKKH